MAELNFLVTAPVIGQADTSHSDPLNYSLGSNSSHNQAACSLSERMKRGPKAKHVHSHIVTPWMAERIGVDGSMRV
jgi:hypothetical protein